jgi:hypothetical protein
MKNNRQIFFLIILLLMPALALLAQDNDFIPDEGEVVEGEFVIRKELEITLPSAQRIFQKVPPEEMSRHQTEPLQYSFTEYTPELPDISTRLRVLKLKEPRITQGPASYIKLGFGNYLTPLFQLGINSGASRTSNVGLHVNHLSSINGPVDKANSGDSETNINLFGKYIGGKASISGDVGYNRLGYHFYGYEDSVEVDRDTIEQNFNDFTVGFRIKNATPDSPFQYNITGKAHLIGDSYDASEFGFKAGLGLGYHLSETMRAGLKLDYLFASYKNPETISRSLVRVHPNFVFSNGVFSADLGFRVVNYNDTLNNENTTYLLPAITVGYHVSDNITAYAALDSDVEEMTFRSVVYENPYINSMLPINHTRRPIDLKVGVKGQAMQFLAYDVGVRAAYYKNMYFYINDPEAFNKFTVLYDQSTTSLYQFYASLSYMKNKYFGSTFSMRLNGWSVGDVAKAWHKPNFELDYSVWYNIYDKVLIGADIFMLSGLEAVDRRTSPQQTVKLDAAIDLNLKIDYKLSERYSVFVSVNNLLNRNYELYYRYPTRGLLAIVGLSLNF